ncbi:MAG: Re/Si-specific NAD(P)(+) transhydrogenase subunit alpha [Acidobacteriota bacterium]|nr:Re/Si-specific NAD(P)(+) transhydrogenase subunit alpha [Acidobacteriota bacterium]
MQITVLREVDPQESRVALTPESVKKLVGLKASVAVESGAGLSLNVSDADYQAAGATVSSDRKALIEAADLLAVVNRPSAEDMACLKSGAMLIGFLQPFDEANALSTLVERGVSAISVEMIPRSTIAQKMDALSSQANLAGYVAVVAAAERLNRIFPMMTTPAGTISPARVFIIGAGVAGLQAIATAKRMGARVDAFDVRPEVEEQIKSLGAKFVKVDLGETGGTAQGYAKQLTEEQLQKQRDVMAKQCAQSDVVITTAQVFGRKAPLIVTAEMIQGMRPGSIVIDLAVDSGGNVDGSKPDQEVVVNDVRIIGIGNGARQVPVHASQMYSSNIVNFIAHFWNKETSQLDLNLDDEIVKGSLIIHNHEVRNENIRNLMR